MNELIGKRLLYVEDDEATRDVMARFLRNRAGKIYLAASGEEGIEKSREIRPHIVIADLIMPGISGLEMIKAIKEDQKDCRVLITSTISEVNTVINAMDIGIDYYIIKPIDTEELVIKLEKMARTIDESHKGHKNCLMMDQQSRLGVIEEGIRREFIRIMKSRLGKGPQDMKLLFFDDTMEIIVVDAYTSMEKTIAENRKNQTVVEQYRKVYYESIAKELEESIGIVLGASARLHSVRADSQKKMDKILLTIF